jgi:hypothetical protein
VQAIYRCSFYRQLCRRQSYDFSFLPLSPAGLDMSASPPKADFCGALVHVCFGPEAHGLQHYRHKKKDRLAAIFAKIRFGVLIKRLESIMPLSTSIIFCVRKIAKKRDALSPQEPAPISQHPPTPWEVGANFYCEVLPSSGPPNVDINEREWHVR